VLFFSCSKDKDTFIEIFDPQNRPFFEYNSETNQYILQPWNYYLPENSKRKYPLVIFLHGSGGAGNVKYLNFLGYDNPDDFKVDSTAYKFQTNYPCFTLCPQTSSGWNISALIQQVENFKNQYRIDESRIYLIGYSMGASSSYSFANDYYGYNQQLFAGIIRLAPWSQTSLRNEVAQNTAIWIQSGIDDANGIKTTRDSYAFLKNFHSGAIESTSAVPIEGYNGTTYYLTINNDDMVKCTEYVGVGHGVVAFPFKDPLLLKWLFNHSL
jgi:predicted peptidase